MAMGQDDRICICRDDVVLKTPLNVVWQHWITKFWVDVDCRNFLLRADFETETVATEPLELALGSPRVLFRITVIHLHNP